MKRLRPGQPGFEIDTMQDDCGQIRSLAGIVPDIAGGVLPLAVAASGGAGGGCGLLRDQPCLRR